MAFWLWPKEVSTAAIARWVYKNSVDLDTGVAKSLFRK
jgi:hypothetical protein